MDCEHTAITNQTDPSSIDSDRESTKSEPSSGCEIEPAKKDNMFIWSEQYEKWHECLVEFYPPNLQITEFEDQKLEVSQNQLKHLTQNWYYGSLTRREARIVLQDFNGGNGSFIVRASESFEGKFAVSFVHEGYVKHVVIETQQDPVAGILYSITPNGPKFTSLYGLIQEAQKTPLIQNHVFNVQLTCSPPKPDRSWLHRSVKSLSQAEQMLRKEHRDGAFFVYRTQSEYAPYIVAYRSNGSILHNLIVYSNQSNGGYTLNHVTSQVLYKVIHYFMENPIIGSTVLRHPVPDRTSVTTNSGLALGDFNGNRDINELRFTHGALVTNIHDKSDIWAKGDHRGDKQKFFRKDCVRLLSRDELAFIKNQKTVSRRIQVGGDSEEESTTHTYTLDLSSQCQVELIDSAQHGSIMSVQSQQAHYKLSSSSAQVLETWYHSLQTSNSDSKIQHKPSRQSRCTIS